LDIPGNCGDPYKGKGKAVGKTLINLARVSRDIDGEATWECLGEGLTVAEALAIIHDAQRVNKPGDITIETTDEKGRTLT
jgi:hypothetical protein